MRSKKAFLNLITNIFREVISIICAFILPHIIISNFGSEIYGLTESITNFLGFIIMLEAGFGPVMKVSLYRALAKKDINQINKILNTSEHFFRKIALFFLIYVLGLSILYPIISNTSFDHMFTAILVLIMAGSIFAEYYFGIIYKLFLQADQKSYIINVIQIITTLLNIILVILAIELGADIIGVKILTGIVFILKPFFQLLYVKKKYKISPHKTKGKYQIEQKWDALIHHIAFMIHSKTDIAILTIISSLKNVAVYSIYSLILNGTKSIVCVIADSFSATFGDMIAKNETKTLKNRFNIYETNYITISTIVYTCTLLLITPFVSVYTKGMQDAEYIQPIFGSLLTIGVYVLTIRQPYNELIKAAGHFRQTRKGAIIEAVINISLSTVMVWRYGLIGVAIGTLAAMTYRTIDLIIYVNKKILKRRVWTNIKKIIVIFIETIVVLLIASIIPQPIINSYLDWVIYAAIILIISTIIILPLNIVLYRNDYKETLRILRKAVLRKNR